GCRRNGAPRVGRFEKIRAVIGGKLAQACVRVREACGRTFPEVEEPAPRLWPGPLVSRCSVPPQCEQDNLPLFRERFSNIKVELNGAHFRKNKQSYSQLTKPSR